MVNGLPVTSPQFRVFQGEDWRDGVMFHCAGQPLDIEAIGFEVDLYARGASTPAATFSTASSTMLAVGASLQMAVASSVLEALAPGGYRVLMFGSEDGQRRLLWDGRLALMQGGN